jgi:hypothetical protein
MRLRRKVENCVDPMLAKHAFHVYWRCDVAVFKCEVFLVIQDPRVVEGRAVVELVERDDVVVTRVCENEMADEPTGTVFCQYLLSMFESANLWKQSALTYMKPAPPVMSIFFASGNGSNLVHPVSTGAFRQSSSVK